MGACRQSVSPSWRKDTYLGWQLSYVHIERVDQNLSWSFHLGPILLPLDPSFVWFSYSEQSGSSAELTFASTVENETKNRARSLITVIRIGLTSRYPGQGYPLNFRAWLVMVTWHCIGNIAQCSRGCD